MSNNYLAFDIEIATEIPEGAEDWKQFRPFGVTCAAAIASDGRQWLWYAQENGEFKPQMTPDQVREMVVTLDHLASGGYKILTWNGLGFEFDVLNEQGANFGLCKHLALNHVDMMFQFFCEKGFPIGLDAAAKGMGQPGKPEGMKGDKAPILWKDRRYLKVLDYVTGDVINTLAVAEAVEKAGAVNWIAKSGRPNSQPIREWLTVEKCLELPEPDTSWMSDPWPRSKFVGWMGEQPKPLKLPGFDVTGVTQWDPDEGNWRYT